MSKDGNFSRSIGGSIGSAPINSASQFRNRATGGPVDGYTPSKTYGNGPPTGYEDSPTMGPTIARPDGKITKR
jgi:hypothetical protein